MLRASITKSAFLIFLFLFANTANAINSNGYHVELTIAFLVVCVVVFLFIMGAVNYFRPTPEEELQDESENTSQETLNHEPREKSQSTYVQVIRKSFLIFIILVIICLIYSTLSMDA